MALERKRGKKRKKLDELIAPKNIPFSFHPIFYWGFVDERGGCNHLSCEAALPKGKNVRPDTRKKSVHMESTPCCGPHQDQAMFF
jgi:hypothetical protein